MRPPALLLIAAVAAWGAEPPQYEVASIKPNTGNVSPLAFRIQPDGALAAAGITLKRLMMTAYNVQDFRIVGGPDWVASRRWDLQAKPNRTASPDQVRQMLRTLLEDRFQLHSHSEKRNMPVYELAVDRKGSKLPKVKDDETKPDVRVSIGSIQLTRATPATFASQLSYALGRPVIDKTNLSGEFDFVLKWTPEPEDGGPPATPEGPSIFTAIPEQLGLRLKSARGPVEVIVIDAVQTPSAN